VPRKVVRSSRINRRATASAAGGRAAAPAQTEGNRLVAGGGITAPGWAGKLDPADEAKGQKVSDAKLAMVGNVLQVTTGPAITYWNPANKATGNYTIKATFILQKPSGHTNYYGLVFGGSDLGGAKQAYTYFLVAQDGTWLVKKRDGEVASDVLIERTRSAVTDVEGKLAGAFFFAINLSIRKRCAMPAKVGGALLLACAFASRQRSTRPRSQHQ
jgi:hypothetical protein